MKPKIKYFKKWDKQDGGWIIGCRLKLGKIVIERQYRSLTDHPKIDKDYFHADLAVAVLALILSGEVEVK